MSLQENISDCFKEWNQLREEIHRLQSRIAELENPWISVDERLPETGEEVFIHDGNFGYKGWYDDWNNNDKRGVFYSDHSQKPVAATHWQPIKEPT